MFKRQCCFPLTITVRCPNDTIDTDKMHCIKHHGKCVNLYLKYKKVCA